MSLKSRLDLLRRQSGAAGPPRAPAPTPASPGTGERLARLRADTRLRSAGRVRPDPRALSQRLGGQLLDGDVIVMERTLPLAHRHGRVALSGLRGCLDGLPEARRVRGEDLLFLDTETSGLAGGTGTIAFLIGAARVRDDSLTVRQYLLTAFGGEAGMLRDLQRWVGDEPVLVTFNGKRFDLPLLRDRYRLVGYREPFSGAAVHLDLLHPVRRLYDGRWGNCRLATVESRLMGFQRDNDLPGAEVPLVWFDFVHRGNSARLPDVATHNFWDLVSLAALLPALAEAHREPVAWSADVLGAARAWLRHGEEERALTMLGAAARVADEPARLELARLLRRRGRWPEAVAIWEGLAGAGSVAAAEHLAKYHEHVRRDCRAALDYAARLPDGMAADQRRDRLHRKLAVDNRTSGG